MLGDVAHGDDANQLAVLGDRDCSSGIGQDVLIDQLADRDVGADHCRRRG